MWSAIVISEHIWQNCLTSFLAISTATRLSFTRWIGNFRPENSFIASLEEGTVTTTTAETIAPAHVDSRIRVGAPIYNEAVEFLYDEASHLDRLELPAWADMLADDLVYTVPIRLNRALADQAATVVRSVKHLDETKASILGRIARLTQTKSAWAEDPPSRQRRLVTNVKVNATAKVDEFCVCSNLLLTRNRFNAEEYQLMSAERTDLIRKTPAGMKLAKREVLLDQATLGMPNLAIFL
jgi:3-phenylpropionate/cinnamic acid dioxygenase small subunit